MEHIKLFSTFKNFIQSIKIIFISLFFYQILL
jgi:cbb3-type cytochrome oxidase subunit 3